MRNFTMTSVSESFPDERTPVLTVRAAYPVFAPSDESDSERRFTDTANAFYKSASERLLAGIGRKTLRLAAAKSAQNGGVCVYSVTHMPSFAGNDYVSTFAHTTFFDGRRTRAWRSPALWSVEHAALLPSGRVFRTDRRTREREIGLILAQIEQNMRRGLFRYYDNYASLVRKHFRFSSFYFVPNGGAFCFDGGVLGADTERSAVFVLPKKELTEILRLYPAEWAEESVSLKSAEHASACGIRLDDQAPPLL